jgi:ABC-type lipoprotein export system ATPase subunit
LTQIKTPARFSALSQSNSRRYAVLVGDINLKVERAEFMAIPGPSGSGKSSLLYLLGLLRLCRKPSLYKDSVKSAGRDFRLGRR